MTRPLSKSKLLAYRQCHKRLWLEVHRPELREDSAASQASFEIGHQVGDLARRLYDPGLQGSLLDPADGFPQLFARTRELLNNDLPLFEAGFTAESVLALADVLLPMRKGKQRVWRMVEVKSTTTVKDYHRDDLAVQGFVARSAGLPLVGVALAHIDNTFVYPGEDDYRGLLKEVDLTEEAFSRTEEVKGWIGEAQAIVRRGSEPKITTGAHCSNPYKCGFYGHCASQEPQAEQPVTWLPRVQTKALKTFLAESGTIELSEVPDELLNAAQLRVKLCSLNDTVYFDAQGAKADLGQLGWPAYFMDFETVNLAVPIWEGTRPYQQITFQFSVHRLGRNGRLTHEEFLDLSGGDPALGFAKALIAACGDIGPVFVYNASFETARIKELAARFPKLSKPLLAINARVVDLLPVAQQRYYHPSQQGSWSIKDVLPAVAPDLSYEHLIGVQNGGMAMDAFREAIHPSTMATRNQQIHRQLLDYCALDTFAMVRLWQFFTGRPATPQP